MKIKYIAYLELLKKYPQKFNLAQKIVPGNDVVVSDELKDLVDEKDIVDTKQPVDIKPETCDGCKKIKVRCVCEQRALSAARKEAMVKAVDPDPLKEDKKKVDERLIVDGQTDKINALIEKKNELKKSGKPKIEQKAELKAFKEEIKKSEEIKPVEFKEESKLNEESKEVIKDLAEKKELEEKVESAPVKPKAKPKAKKKSKKKGKLRKDPVSGEFFRENGEK